MLDHVGRAFRTEDTQGVVSIPKHPPAEPQTGKTDYVKGLREVLAAPEKRCSEILRPHDGAEAIDGYPYA